jgi:hypothetical protein
MTYDTKTGMVIYRSKLHAPLKDPCNNLHCFNSKTPIAINTGKSQKLHKFPACIKRP